MNNKQIKACELEYTKCFAKVFEDGNIVRFRDDLIPDMYYYNCSLIKNSMSAKDLCECIEQEITLRIYENENYCNILLNTTLDAALLDAFSYKPDISINGYYLFDIKALSKMVGIENCDIVKVESDKLVDELLSLDLLHYEKTLGEDFCKRRVYRKGKVYLSDSKLNSYLYYHNDVLIGKCELFTYENIAKIESFAVAPSHQRQGYGTTILKAMILKAIEAKADTIYCVADEEDTAKEMYLKNGFTKIGETNDLFFKF